MSTPLEVNLGSFLCWVKPSIFLVVAAKTMSCHIFRGRNIWKSQQDKMLAFSIGCRTICFFLSNNHDSQIIVVFEFNTFDLFKSDCYINDKQLAKTYISFSFHILSIA